MEKQQPTPESQPQQVPELQKLAAERLDKLEKATPDKVESREKAVAEAREQLKAVTAEQAPKPEAKPEPKTLMGVLTKSQNYRQTMVSLQHRLKPASRTFSKVIHNQTVENVSELAGKTVMRPSVSLGATTTAVAVTIFLYLSARYYGFQLRGSEVWISLLVGGGIGLLAEALIKSIRRLRGQV